MFFWDFILLLLPPLLLLLLLLLIIIIIIIIINRAIGTHTPSPVCEKEDVTIFWNPGVHADRDVTANKPHLIIKNKKRKHAQ